MVVKKLKPLKSIVTKRTNMFYYYSDSAWEFRESLIKHNEKVLLSIDQQVETEKKNKMDNEQEKLINWKESLKTSDYYKLGENRVKMEITHFRVAEVVKKFDGDKDPKVLGEFRASILTVDDEPFNKPMLFNNSSKRFRKSLDKAASKAGFDFSELDSTEVISFRVKKIGESTDTNYDVEDFSVISKIIEE